MDQIILIVDMFVYCERVVNMTVKLQFRLALQVVTLKRKRKSCAIVECDTNYCCLV